MNSDDQALPADGQRRVVDVAICTYRRATLAATLASIAAQRLGPEFDVRVIVADNDTLPTAQAEIVATAAALGLTLRYVHAPARNISVARNACLDAASAPLLAFIDDDEVATAGWLAALVAQLDETGADVVLGPAIADYPDGVPGWVRRADLHSTRPPGDGAHAIASGYTCNVLLRVAALGQRRFDPALGRSGGEDDVFFAAAVRDGARIAFAPAAVVRDPVPTARANLRWLCRRSFRNGQTFARISIDSGKPAVREFAKTAAKLGYCAIGVVAGLPSAVRWRRFAVRGALHAGACMRYLGRSEIELY